MKEKGMFLVGLLILCSLMCILPVAAAPNVVSTDPTGGATGVLGIPTITVTFDKSISDDSSHPLTGTITISDGTNNINYDYAWAYGTHLEFGKNSGLWLSPHTTYTVTITGFKDLDGDPMTPPYSWTFTTGADTTPPTVISTDPPDKAIKVPVNVDAITVTFNEPIQYTPNPGVPVKLLSDGYVNYPMGPISVSGNTLIIHAPNSPNPWLENWKPYYVTVGGVKDSAGNEMVHQNGNGNTVNYIQFSFQTVSTDTTAPTVVSTYPASDAITVPPDVTITAQMSKTINNCVGSVTVVDNGGNPVLLQYPTHFFKADDYRNLEIKPLSPLVEGKTYTVTITGLIDDYYNAMDSYSWSFTVEGPPTTEIAVQDSFSTHPRCGWFNTSVLVTLSATDHSGSGIANTEYSLDGGSTWTPYSIPFTLDTEGVTTVTYHSIDHHGNVEPSQSLQVKIDKTPPTIAGAVIDPVTENLLLPNANGWYSSGVTVRFTFQDALSGITGEGSPADMSICSEGASQVAKKTVQDMPGNPATATLSVNIDKTPPEIAITMPVNCAHYIMNEVVPADWSVSDALSGIETQSGAVPTGAAIDTSTAGPKQFSVTATDQAGNTVTKTNSYTVDTPADATKDLNSKIVGLGLPPGVNKALTGTLGVAQTQITQQRYGLAKITLLAFNIEVRTQQGKTLTTDQARDLITTAQRIIRALPGK
jgi:hypothetical protein